MRFLIVFFFFLEKSVFAAALTSWGSLDNPVKYTVPGQLNVYKGQGVDTLYPLEVDQTLGALPIEGVAGGTPIPISGTIMTSNPSVGATGSSVPADATYIGALNGGNLVGLIADSSGRQVIAGAGTAGSATAGVMTIQGVASMTAVQTTPSLATGATFQDGVVAAGSLTTSFATVLTTGGVVKHVDMRNNTNGIVVVSLNNGSSTSYTLDPSDQVSLDLANNGVVIGSSTPLQAKYTGSAPTTGNFRINCFY